MVSADELRDEEEYEEILEDMREEGGKFGMHNSQHFWNGCIILILKVQCCLQVYAFCCSLSLSQLGWHYYVYMKNFNAWVNRAIGERRYPSTKTQWRANSRSWKGILFFSYA